MSVILAGIRVLAVYSSLSLHNISVEINGAFCVSKDSLCGYMSHSPVLTLLGHPAGRSLITSHSFAHSRLELDCVADCYVSLFLVIHIVRLHWHAGIL